MIEILSAENGEKILRANGRLLASRYNPSQEAKDWLSRRTDFIDKVRTIIVLGLGSGHHVLELLAQTQAQILIIDVDKEIVEATSNLHRFPSDRLKIEVVQRASELRRLTSIKKAVTESFVVMTHPASLAAAPKIYEECRQQLLGRDWGTLNWQWNLRGVSGFDTTAKVSSVSDKALTIYDLEQTELVQNSEEREKLLFRALRELVK